MLELIEINLLPIEQRKVKRDYTFMIDHRVIWPTLVIILLLVAYNLGKAYFQNNLDKKTAEIDRLDAQINENRVILDQIHNLETILSEKDAKNRSLRSITYNKQLWVRILEGINIALPPNSWLSEIVQKPENESEMIIRGTTFVFSEVAALMIDLEKNDYFEKVMLEQIEVTPSSSRDAFQFTLACRLNLSIGSAHPIDTKPK